MTGVRSGPITRTIVACVLIAILLVGVLALRQFDSRSVSSDETTRIQAGTDQVADDEQTSIAAESAPLEVSPKIVGWRVVEDLPEEIALFETVFWEPRDTTTLRALLRERMITTQQCAQRALHGLKQGSFYIPTQAYIKSDIDRRHEELEQAFVVLNEGQ